MSKWIEGLSPDGSGRMIKAERHIWQINIHQKYFTNVVLLLAERFFDNFCQICEQEHYTKSGLIKCLKSHRNDTVNYYLDKVII